MRLESSLNICAGAMIGWLGGCLIGTTQLSNHVPNSAAATLVTSVSAPRIAAGTTLTVRLGDPLSSRTARRGDSWRGVLLQNLVTADGTVIEAGGAVDGIVSDASATRGSHGALSLRAISVSARGRIVAVRAALDPVASRLPATAPSGPIAIREGTVMVFRAL